MTLENGYHDVGGVLDGEIPGPGPDRGHREAREFPLARLFQRRAPRACHAVAGHWLGVASYDGVDHELRRQVAATGGDHRRPYRELLLELQPARERRASHRLQPADGRRGRIETGRGRAHDRRRREEREIVHDHADHPPPASRERRYIRVASSGRLSRSSTIPRPYSALAFRGSSSTARSKAARAPERSFARFRALPS